MLAHLSLAALVVNLAALDDDIMPGGVDDVRRTLGRIPINEPLKGAALKRLLDKTNAKPVHQFKQFIAMQPPAPTWPGGAAITIEHGLRFEPGHIRHGDNAAHPLAPDRLAVDHVARGNHFDTSSLP